MAMATVGLLLVGEADLLMHNERLANPFDPITRAIAAITSKGRRQTDDDKHEVQRLEWEGGLYFSDKLGPYIPGANLKKCLMEAATAFRGGMAVKRGVIPMEAEIPLQYPGPRTPEGLWDAGFVDIRGVKLNGRTKVQRSRPRFSDWRLETNILLNTSVLDFASLAQYLAQAGTITGLGDYRPTFGRFLGTASLLAMDEQTTTQNDDDEEEEELHETAMAR